VKPIIRVSAIKQAKLSIFAPLIDLNCDGTTRNTKTTESIEAFAEGFIGDISEGVASFVWEYVCDYNFCAGFA
jgi:hypothetical protein